MTNRVRFSADIDDKVSGKLDRMRDKFDRLGSNKGAQAILQGVGISAGIGAMNALGSAVGVVTDKLAEGVKSAVEEEASIAKLTQALDTNVSGWQSHQGAIDAAISAGQRLAFTDDELRDSLTSLSVRTKDVSRALELQRTAMDLARLKGIDLATASELVGKVYGGNVGILARYGIAVEKGASATEALGQIQKQAAGQAEEFATTTAGAMAGANIAIDELFESIAAEAMPVIRELAFTVRDDVLPAMKDFLQAAKDAEPLWDALGGAIGVVLNGPLGGGLDIAQRKIDEFREAQQQALTDAATAWGQSADGQTEALREMNRGLVGAKQPIADLGDEWVNVKERTLGAVDEIVAGLEASMSDLRQVAAAAASAIWDPVILMDELGANSRELADQRRILSSATATAAEKADARARIHELQREQFELKGTAAAMDLLPEAAAAAFRADAIRNWAGATGAARAEIDRLIDRLYEAKEVARDAFSVTGQSGSGGNHRAHGGPVWPGVWTVGENGPETLVVGPGMSGHVYADGGRAGGAAVTIGPGAIVVNGVSDPEEIARRIVQPLRRELKRQGMSLA